MNAGDLYPLFAAMLTQRPWEQVRVWGLRWWFWQLRGWLLLMGGPAVGEKLEGRGCWAAAHSFLTPLRRTPAPILPPPRSLTSASTTWRCPRRRRTGRCCRATHRWGFLDDKKGGSLQWGLRR
jgi:hypothetical protein